MLEDVKLDIHDGRTLQNFKAFLIQFEVAGVMDVRTVREKVERHLNAKLRPGRMLIPHKDRGPNISSTVYEECPSCTKHTLTFAMSGKNPLIVDGNAIKRCTCGYSTMIPVGNGE